MGPRNQMIKQNYEACAVGAKMGTIKGRAKPAKIWGKDQIDYGHGTLEDAGQRLNRGRTLHNPDRARKEIRSFERKPALPQTLVNVWRLIKDLKAGTIPTCLISDSGRHTTSFHSNKYYSHHLKSSYMKFLFRDTEESYFQTFPRKILLSPSPPVTISSIF